MQAGILRWLILAMGILALAGCDRQVRPRRPLVFYDETGDPSEKTTALSELELREIGDWVATQTPDPIWLIRVKPWIGEGKRGGVIAYIVPDEMTPRIRTGRAYGVPESKQPPGVHSPWRYAQVSMPDRNFTEHFIRPPLSELPFEWPMIADPNSQKTSPMSKEEVIAIVDFVHQPSSYKELTAPRGISGDNIRRILESPILHIERTRNQIDVQLGFMHGLMWGDGLSVELECTPTGYKATSWGEWVS